MKKPVPSLTELAKQVAQEHQGQPVHTGYPGGATHPSFNTAQLGSLQAMSQNEDHIALAQSLRERGRSYITAPSSGRRIAVEYQFLGASEVTKLRPSLYNVRDCQSLCREDVEDIYASIESDGVIHPPFLLESNGDFDVVDGWRRTYCLSEQNKGGMFGILRPDVELTPMEIRSISMVSNIRVGNSIWEIGRFVTAVQNEVGSHLTDRDLATRCGQPLSIVNISRRAYAIPLDVYQLFDGKTRLGRPAIAKLLKLWEPLAEGQREDVLKVLQNGPQEMKTAKAMSYLSTVIKKVTGRTGEHQQGEKIGSYIVRRAGKKAIQIEYGSDEELAVIVDFLRSQAGDSPS